MLVPKVSGTARTLTVLDAALTPAVPARRRGAPEGRSLAERKSPYGHPKATSPTSLTSCRFRPSEHHDAVEALHDAKVELHRAEAHLRHCEKRKPRDLALIRAAEHRVRTAKENFEQCQAAVKHAEAAAGHLSVSI